MRYLLLILTLLLFTVPVAQAGNIKTTEELIRAMQKQYGKSWYKNATFVQKTTNFEADGSKKVATWDEAMSVPGSFCIDFAPSKEGNDILFTVNTIYSFKDRTQHSCLPYCHPLLVLG